MGDVVSLVEKAQDAIDAETALQMQEKMRKRTFDYNDFLKQMKSVRKMGSLKGMLGMIPGLGQLMGEMDDEDLNKDLRRVEAIINSMTPEERANDEMLRKTGTRRMRIAKGSGSTLQEVTELIRQFDQAKTMMQHVMSAGMEGMGGMGGMAKMMMSGKLPPELAGKMPPGMPQMPGMGPDGMPPQFPPGMMPPPPGAERRGGRDGGGGAGRYLKKGKKKKRKGR